MGSMAAYAPLWSNNDASLLNATSKSHDCPPDATKHQIAANLGAKLILDSWETALQGTGKFHTERQTSSLVWQKGFMSKQKNATRENSIGGTSNNM